MMANHWCTHTETFQISSFIIYSLQVKISFQSAFVHVELAHSRRPLFVFFFWHKSTTTQIHLWCFQDLFEILTSWALNYTLGNHRSSKISINVKTVTSSRTLFRSNAWGHRLRDTDFGTSSDRKQSKFKPHASLTSGSFVFLCTDWKCWPFHKRQKADQGWGFVKSDFRARRKLIKDFFYKWSPDNFGTSFFTRLKRNLLCFCLTHFLFSFNSFPIIFRSQWNTFWLSCTRVH